MQTYTCKYIHTSKHGRQLDRQTGRPTSRHAAGGFVEQSMKLQKRVTEQFATRGAAWKHREVAFTDLVVLFGLAELLFASEKVVNACEGWRIRGHDLWLLWTLEANCISEQSEHRARVLSVPWRCNLQNSKKVHLFDLNECEHSSFLRKPSCTKGHLAARNGLRMVSNCAEEQSLT